jgi:hypothetical protein
LTLFRRDESGVSRAARARRARGRARRPPAHAPGFLVEELEPRVLLSASSFELPIHFFALHLPAISAAYSPLAQHSLVAQPSETTSFQSQQPANRSFDWPPARNSSSLVFLRAQPLAPTNASMVVVLDQQVAGNGASTSVNALEGATMQGGGVPNSLMLVRPDTTTSSASGGEIATGFEGTGDAPTGAMEAPGRPAYLVGATAVGVNGGGAYASPAGGGSWQYVPVAPLVNLSGVLDAGQLSMTYQIPLSSLNQILGLSLHGSGGDGEIPVLGELELVNQMGVPLEELGPAYGPGQMAPQAMAVAFKNVPAGGHLDVQIMAAGPSSEGNGSTTLTQTGVTGVTAPASQAANWNVSFVLDVQRQDVTSTAQETASAVQGRPTIGTLIVATPPQSAAFLFSSSDASPAAPSDDDSALGQATATSVSSESPPASDSDDGPFDSFNLRVSSGPLASRSASPLGPSLAAVDAEPTQPVDRRERALLQEIDGLENSDGAQSVAWRSRDTEPETAANLPTPAGTPEYSGGGGAVVAVLGRGGFPLKVTSGGHGERAGLTELWATLPSDSDLSGSAEAHISVSGVPLTTPTEPAEGPDYVKAAFGLAIGVGLTSGPLFPDLVASLPRRIPRWLVAVRPRSGRQGLASVPGHGKRWLSAWLRGLIRRR